MSGTPTGRRLGLLGGTFDPPHVGHLVVASTALDVLGLDEVRLLVAGDPWMKADRDVTPGPLRVAMVAAAIGDDPRMRVDDREVRRDGPTYTVDTLRELRSEHPDDELVFLLGADAASRLPQWHAADEVLALATFVAVDRPGHPLPRLPDGVRVIEVPALDVASSDLRAAVAAGRSIRHLVPPAVHRIVRHHRLYGPPDPDPEPT